MSDWVRSTGVGAFGPTAFSFTGGRLEIVRPSEELHLVLGCYSDIVRTNDIPVYYGFTLCASQSAHVDPEEKGVAPRTFLARVVFIDSNDQVSKRPQLKHSRRDECELVGEYCLHKRLYKVLLVCLPFAQRKKGMSHPWTKDPCCL